MILPKNERRQIGSVDKKVIWLYGAPFSGKTFLANRFPAPLMLNTDGNIRFVDAPYIAIKDDVTVEGRRTTRKFAWEIFKEAIAELEKHDNDFKTIVVDLLEDCYEHCRAYMYDHLNIEHESDDNYRAWDKVRFEFLTTIRRLTNLDYENIIIISHEDKTLDLTGRSGSKYASIKPNLNDKIARKISGMVDIVGRTIANGDERVLSFKTSEIIFGGGRLNVKKKEIPLEYEPLMQVYAEANAAYANSNSNAADIGEVPKEEQPTATAPENGDSSISDAPEVLEQEQKPRQRKKRGE